MSVFFKASKNYVIYIFLLPRKKNSTFFFWQIATRALNYNHTKHFLCFAITLVSLLRFPPWLKIYMSENESELIKLKKEDK